MIYYSNSKLTLTIADCLVEVKSVQTNGDLWLSLDDIKFPIWILDLFQLQHILHNLSIIRIILFLIGIVVVSSFITYLLHARIRANGIVAAIVA